MRVAPRGLLPVLCSAIILCATTAAARSLSFEDRVLAQEAIDRVYYSHQIGATKSFEEAIPRETLERKVRIYLQTPVTEAALDPECLDDICPL
jgi:hypothetical protein